MRDLENLGNEHRKGKSYPPERHTSESTSYEAWNNKAPLHKGRKCSKYFPDKFSALPEAKYSYFKTEMNVTSN